MIHANKTIKRTTLVILVFINIVFGIMLISSVKISAVRQTWFMKYGFLTGRKIADL